MFRNGNNRRRFYVNWGLFLFFYIKKSSTVFLWFSPFSLLSSERCDITIRRESTTARLFIYLYQQITRLILKGTTIENYKIMYANLSERYKYRNYHNFAEATTHLVPLVSFDTPWKHFQGVSVVIFRAVWGFFIRSQAKFKPSFPQYLF